MITNSKMKLGDILNVLTDYHANGSYEILKANVELLDEPDYAVMIRTTNFEQNDFRINLKYITEEAYEFLSKSKVYPNDILMNKIANAGAIYRVPDLGTPISLAMNLFLLRVNPEKADQVYVYYYLKGIEQSIKSLANGTATKTITKDAVRNIEINIPDLCNQKQLGYFLSCYDNLIQNNEKKIVILENIAEEIYREWFVRMRFPGYETNFEAEGWETSTIEKSFEILGGGTPSKECDEYWSNGDINWFTPTDITASKGVFLNESFLKTNSAGIKNSSAKIFPAYSVMMTSRATIGEIGINTTPASTNQGFIVCLPNDSIPFSFIYFWLRHNKDLIKSLGSGSTFPEISKSTFKKIEFIKPSEKKMNDFKELVNPMLKQIEVLQNKNINLRKTRDLLLPRLMSGKLQVKEAERELISA